jgi:hypothetical protein
LEPDLLLSPGSPSDNLSLTPDCLLSPTLTLPPASPASVLQDKNVTASVIGVKRRVKGIQSIKESIREETQRFGVKMSLHESVFKCNQCDFQCPEVAEYIARKHASRKNCLYKPSVLKKPIVYQKCRECDFSTKFTKELKVHVKIHMEKKHICSICSKSFLERRVYRQHVRDHAKGYICEQCNSSFAREGELKRHIKFKHKDKLLQETMKEKLSRARNMEAMGLIEETRNIYTELVTSFRVKNIKEKYSQFEQRHGNYKRALELLKETIPKISAQIKCNQCGKQFSNKYNLVRHKEKSCVRKPQ